MPSVEVRSLEGEVLGSVDLPEEVFAIEPSEGAIYYVTKAHLANRRQGNASTKTRAEVDLSKRKLYRQKGTGRSRAGTAGSPIRVGGGVAHGPKPRGYRERVPKKVKRLALRTALTAKAAEGQVTVLEDFSLEEPKTKRMADMLRALGAEGRKVLLLTDETGPALVKSCRNLPRLSVRPVAQVSAYEVILADTLLLTRKGLERAQAHWGTP